MTVSGRSLRAPRALRRTPRHSGCMIPLHQIAFGGASMATRVGTHVAKTCFSEYLSRVAYGGERFLIERHGRPVAALVSVSDFEHLEGRPPAEKPEELESTVTDEEVRRLVKQAAATLVIRMPSGPPVERSERHPIRIPGPPLSEDIIADRR